MSHQHWVLFDWMLAQGWFFEVLLLWWYQTILPLSVEWREVRIRLVNVHHWRVVLQCWLRDVVWVLLKMVQRSHSHMLESSGALSTVSIGWTNRWFVTDIHLSSAFLMTLGFDHLHLWVANALVDVKVLKWALSNILLSSPHVWWMIVA